MIIAIGVALSIFATQVLALSLRNQGLRADVGTGASTVLTVSVPRDGDLLEAVRAADPSGRYAMAVKDTRGRRLQRAVSRDCGRQHPAGRGQLLVLGSGRTSRTWLPRCAETVTPAIELRGTELEVDLADVRADGQAAAGSQRARTRSTLHRRRSS